MAATFARESRCRHRREMVCGACILTVTRPPRCEPGRVSFSSRPASIDDFRYQIGVPIPVLNGFICAMIDRMGLPRIYHDTSGRFQQNVLTQATAPPSPNSGYPGRPPTPCTPSATNDLIATGRSPDITKSPIKTSMSDGGGASCARRRREGRVRGWRRTGQRREY